MPRAKIKARVGDVVEVLFLDHCEGGSDIIEFYTYGQVVSITKTTLRVAHWFYKDGFADDDNCSWFDLVNGAVLRVRVLR